MAPTFFDDLQTTMIPCPICAGDSFEDLCGLDRYRIPIHTVRCESCGLIMTNPMPTDDALGEFYQRHYRRYYRKLDTPDLSYIKRYALDGRAQITVDQFKDAGLVEPGARVLDLGCGEGSILRAIVEQCPGVRAEGVEINNAFATFAEQYSGCTIHRRLEDIEQSPERRTYDLILLSHVLEHLIDPVDMLRRLGALLSPTGVLFIDVPDVCHYHWLADLHIAHVYHFSLRTLTAVTRRAGLEVDWFNVHQPPKLPKCVRILARPNATAPAMPSVEVREAAAVARIKRMGRFAWPFSQLFRLTMWSYETWWNRRSATAGGSVPPPVVPRTEAAPVVEIVTTGFLPTAPPEPSLPLEAADA